MRSCDILLSCVLLTVPVENFQWKQLDRFGITENTLVCTDHQVSRHYHGTTIMFMFGFIKVIWTSCSSCHQTSLCLCIIVISCSVWSLLYWVRAVKISWCVCFGNGRPPCWWSWEAFLLHKTHSRQMWPGWKPVTQHMELSLRFPRKKVHLIIYFTRTQENIPHQISFCFHTHTHSHTGDKTGVLQNPPPLWHKLEEFSPH